MNQPIRFDNSPTHIITFSELPEGIEFSIRDRRSCLIGRLDWDQLNQFTEWIATIGTDIPSTDYTPYD